MEEKQYVTEWANENLGLTLKITKMLHEEQTPYQKIQIAVISHMDIDHYSGIKELLEMGKIKYLGLPEIPKDETMKKIIGIAKKRGTTIFYLSRGRQITTKDGSVASSKEQSDGKECGIVGNAGKNTWISGAVNGRCGKRR